MRSAAGGGGKERKEKERGTASVSKDGAAPISGLPEIGTLSAQGGFADLRCFETLPSAAPRHEAARGPLRNGEGRQNLPMGREAYRERPVPVGLG